LFYKPSSGLFQLSFAKKNLGEQVSYAPKGKKRLYPMRSKSCAYCSFPLAAIILCAARDKKGAYCFYPFAAIIPSLLFS